MKNVKMTDYVTNYVITYYNCTITTDVMIYLPLPTIGLPHSKQEIVARPYIKTELYVGANSHYYFDYNT